MDEKGDFIMWVVIIGIFIGISYFFLGGESEGIINDLDSCKEAVKIEDVFRNKIFTNYTCTYDKASNGKIIGGSCAKIKLNSNGICTKAYIYEKKSEVVCQDKEKGFVNSDGVCQCQYGYVFDEGSKKCIEY